MLLSCVLNVSCYICAGFIYACYSHVTVKLKCMVVQSESIMLYFGCIICILDSIVSCCADIFHVVTSSIGYSYIKTFKYGSYHVLQCGICIQQSCYNIYVATFVIWLIPVMLLLMLIQIQHTIMIFQCWRNHIALLSYKFCLVV